MKTHTERNKELLEQKKHIDELTEKCQNEMIRLAVDMIGERKPQSIADATGKGLSTVVSLTGWRYRPTLKWLANFNNKLIYMKRI